MIVLSHLLVLQIHLLLHLFASRFPCRCHFAGFSSRWLLLLLLLIDRREARRTSSCKHCLSFVSWNEFEDVLLHYQTFLRLLLFTDWCNNHFLLLLRLSGLHFSFDLLDSLHHWLIYFLYRLLQLFLEFINIEELNFIADI